MKCFHPYQRAVVVVGTVMSWRGVVAVDGGSWEERVFAFVCSQCVFPANAADAAQ